LNDNLLIEECHLPNKFALTFDDGPNDLTLKHIELFERKNIKVTFFFVASHLNDTKMEKIVKLAMKKGHEIGNHNFYHNNIEEELQNSNEEEIKKYMRKSTQIFYKKLGVAPKYFRPPYGAINNRITKILNKLNFKIALWNLDTNDWYWEEEGRDKLKIVETFTEELSKPKNERENSYISLQHEKSKNPEAEIERLNHIIDLIQMKNYEIVTLSECLNDKNPYFDKDQLALLGISSKIIKKNFNI